MCQLLFTVGLLMTCLRWTSAADVPEGTVYVEVNGTAVLHPGSALTGNIRKVLWKYNDDIAAESYRSVTISYLQFKGRCELNTTTGELTIKHLTLSDSGFYSAEINGYEVNTVQLQVMSPVPKPLVSTLCDPAKTYCLLTCEGTSSVPESLQYRWKEENDWSHSMKVLKITKENKEPEFRCELKNPVSSSRSDPVQNPFITGNSLWIIAVVLVILLIVIVAVVLYYKRKHICQKEADAEKKEEIKLDPKDQSVPPAASGPGEAGDEEEPGETTELLSQSGGVQQESRGGGVQQESRERTVYKEVDGTAVLHPGSAHTGNITNILWKYNGSVVARLLGGSISFLHQFEGRCELNTTTGELTIKHLTLSDRGIYSAEINGKESNTVQLWVIKETVYEEVDDTAVLHPGSAHTRDIRAVTWKLNGFKIAEWDGMDVLFYRHSHKGRCELNTRTGELTINHLTLSDSGSYSVQINGKETNTVQLQVMKGTVCEEVGGTAVLHPGSALSVTRILWTHNGEAAVQWSGGNVSIYKFKDRCELNTRTGELTINHLTLSDSGSYSVQINGSKVNTVQLQVMRSWT